MSAARGESLASHRDGRGAPPARRDDREPGPPPRVFCAVGWQYREYLREEQRSRRGCIARRMQPDFHHGLSGPAGAEERCLSRLSSPTTIRLFCRGFGTCSSDRPTFSSLPAALMGTRRSMRSGPISLTWSSWTCECRDGAVWTPCGVSQIKSSRVDRCC